MKRLRTFLIGSGASLFALAVGVALGAGPLNEPASSLGDISSEVPVGDKVDSALANFNAEFTAETAKDVLGGTLNGQSVVVMTTPDADSADVDGVIEQLKVAGAEITGQVDFDAAFLSASNRQFVEGVARQAATGVDNVTNAKSSYEAIGAAVGRAFLASKPGRIDDTAATIGSALSEGKLLTIPSKLSQRASLAVLVVGSTHDDDINTVIGSMISPVGEAGRGVVVAGPSEASERGGVIAALRASSATPGVSTVDVVDSVAGRVMTALAVAALANGEPGAWGTNRSADGAVPQ